MREIQIKELLIGMLIGAVISLFLIWWANHQPGTLLLEIELPPLQLHQFWA